MEALELTIRKISSGDALSMDCSSGDMMCWSTSESSMESEPITDSDVLDRAASKDPSELDSVGVPWNADVVRDVAT